MKRQQLFFLLSLPPFFLFPATVASHVHYIRMRSLPSFHASLHWFLLLLLEFSVPPPSLEFSVLSSFPPPLTVEFVAPCFSHRISQSKTQITALLSFLHDSPHTWIFWYGGNDPACVSLCASEIRRADLYFRGKRGNAKRPVCVHVWAGRLIGLQKKYGCNFVCVQTIRQKPAPRNKCICTALALREGFSKNNAWNHFCLRLSGLNFCSGH